MICANFVSRLRANQRSVSKLIPHICLFTANGGLAVPCVQPQLAGWRVLLAERGIVASYETVRRWRRKFGRTFSDRCAAAGQATNGTSTRCSSGPGCAALSVARRGSARRRSHVLVQPRRDAKAAKGFFRRLLKACQYDPRVIVTDKLRSYGVAQRHSCPEVNIDEADIRTTARRTRIVRLAAGSVRCNDQIT